LGYRMCPSFIYYNDSKGGFIRFIKKPNKKLLGFLFILTEAS